MKKNGQRRKIFFLILFLGWVIGIGVVQAQGADTGSETFEARVERELERETVLYPGTQEPVIKQTLELVIATGERRGEKITLVNGNVPLATLREYRPGDQVVILHNFSGELYTITDLVRRPALILLAVIFVLAALTVGRWQGLTSLLGLGLSFALIFTFVLPQIAAGANPIIIVIIASVVIIPLIFLLAHGFHQKTLVAMLATFLSMIITGLITAAFVAAARLTGLASEEAGFLLAENPALINFKNLLLAGMLIATLGVLDDITVAQAAVVEELRQANPQLRPLKLYQQAMKIGRDHIASMVNTLILVYAGASFPLLLLFQRANQSLSLTLNYELIAAEVVRTLTGSLGLIIAVPLTTALAVSLAQIKNAGQKSSLKVKLPPTSAC